MKVVVNQSNYLPWKGYFDLIHDADLFVFYDDVQFTKNDWRNRNRFKTARGLEWLSVPVGKRIDRLICEVELPPASWADAHWRVLESAYSRAPFFATYAPRLHAVLTAPHRTLAELNHALTQLIARDFLGANTRFDDSRRHPAPGRSQERLLALLRSVGATTYISGPAARAYIDPAAFASAGIELVWKDYSGYPEYPQFHPPFEHAVSVIDLIFHTGPDAPHYIWGWRKAC